MNKKIIAVLTGAALLFTGCGAAAGTASTADSAGTSSTASTASGSSSAASETVDSAPVVEDTIDSKGISAFVTLGDYKGQVINYPDDTAIENGMIANIDYVGTIDGTEFDGGSSTDYDLKIGSGSFIDGFEDQLVGHKKGEKVTVNVTFPTSYGNSEVAGKDAQFAVTINSVKKQSLEDAFTAVSNSSKVLQYPKDLMDTLTSFVTNTYSYYATTYSMDYDSFLAAAGVSVDTAALSSAKTILVADAILDKEGITKDSTEYTDMEKNVLSSNGFADEQAAQDAGALIMVQSSTGYSLACEAIQKYAAS